MPIKFRKSFTIFELLIVVVIISIVYTLFIQGLNRFEKKTEYLKLTGLYEFLSENDFNDDTSIECTLDYVGKCGNCTMYIDGVKSGEPFDLFQDKKITSYFLSEDDELEEIDLGKRRLDRDLRKICFKYTLKSNDSSSSFLLEYDDNSYIVYTPYFANRAITHPSLDASKKTMIALKNLPKEALNGI